MVQIVIDYDVEDAIEARLRGRGYEESLIGDIVDDILEDWYRILAQDLRDGESDWPVDTGYSQASFYADGDTLQNYASYAFYVENNTGAVNDYVATEFDSILDRALDLAVIPRPEPTRQRNLFAPRRPSVRSLIGAGLARFPGLAAPPLIFRTQRVNPFTRGIRRRGNRR